jgi:hypothetical protein
MSCNADLTMNVGIPLYCVLEVCNLPHSKQTGQQTLNLNSKMAAKQVLAPTCARFAVVCGSL